MGKQLITSNEQFDGEYDGVQYIIKFHDRIQKANVNMSGVHTQAFAILGSAGLSENRKPIRAMLHAFIDALNSKGNQ